MVGQDMHVRWRQHQVGMLGYLRHLLASEVFVDVTLCCQGKRLKAHRVLLSACSPYLQELLTAHHCSEHTTIILDDISYEDMRFLLDFVYTGGVTVPEERLPGFLDAAHSLQITALTNQHLHQKIPARTPPALIKVAQDKSLYQNCRQYKDLPPIPGHNGYKSEFSVEYDHKPNGMSPKLLMEHDGFVVKTEHKLSPHDVPDSPKHSPIRSPSIPSPQHFSPIPNGINGVTKCDTSSSGSSPIHDGSDFQWVRPLPSLMPISASSALNHRQAGAPVAKHPRRSLGGILTPSPWAQNGRPQVGAPRVIRSPRRSSERSDEFDQSESRLVASPNYIPMEPNGLHGSPRIHDTSSRSDGDSSSEPPSILRENDENRPEGLKLSGLKERRLQDFYRDQLLSNGSALKVPEEPTELPFKQPLLLEKIQRYSEQPYHFTNKLHHISRILGADNGASYRAEVNPLHGLKTLASLLEDNSNSSNSNSSDPPGVHRLKSLSCSDLTEPSVRNDTNNNEGNGDLPPPRCEDCGKIFDGHLQLQQHQQNQECLSCLPCGKQFASKSQWLEHQKQHEDSKQEHACTHCTKTFVTRASLKVHLRTHTGEKPFHCLECGKQFSQLRNYKYHRSVHEGTREFAATCPECGKYFNDRGYLSSHMKIHRNRKEYGCEYCGKSFNQRVAYNMHVRIHTGEKPHVCPHCNKSFSRKMLLKQHLRIHTGEKPFTCVVCQKAFADRSNMTLHMRLHSGVKPYTCTVCNKSFTKKHHLKTHMNYHTGVKPYACSKCGLRFSQSSNMRTHFKKCSSTAYPDLSQPPAQQPENMPLNMVVTPSPTHGNSDKSSNSVVSKDNL